MVDWYLIHQFCKMFCNIRRSCCTRTRTPLPAPDNANAVRKVAHSFFLNLSRFRVYKKLIIGFSKLQPQPSSSSTDKVRVVFIMDSFSAPAAVPLQKWLIQIFSSNSTQVGGKKEKKYFYCQRSKQKKFKPYLKKIF